MQNWTKGVFLLMSVVASYYYATFNFKLQKTLSLIIAPVLALSLWLAVLRYRRSKFIKYIEEGGIKVLPGSNIFTGHASRLRNWQGSDVKTEIKHLHDKYGESICVFYGSQPLILSIDLDLIYKIFVATGIKEVNTDEFDSIFRHIQPSDMSLLRLRDRLWKQSHKALLTITNTKDPIWDEIYEKVHSSCRETMKTIWSQPHSSESRIRSCDIQSICENLNLNIVFRLIFEGKGGSRSTQDTQQVVEKVHRFLQAYKNTKFDSCTSDSTLMSSCLTSDSSQMESGLDRLCSYIDERLATLKSEPQTRYKLVDAIIASLDPDLLKSRENVHDILYFLHSGLLSLTGTLVSLMWHLAKNPQEQEKLRTSIFKNGPENIYSTWCINETLRLMTPSLLGARRTLSEDIQFRGKTLRRGCTLVPNMYAIHRSTLLWGPDADQFRPDRFSELGSKQKAKFMPFGIGSRACLGQDMSKRIVALTSSQILMMFNIEANHKTPEKIESDLLNVMHPSINYNQAPIELSFIPLS